MMGVNTAVMAHQILRNAALGILNTSIILF